MANVTNIEEFDDGSAKLDIDLTKREVEIFLAIGVEQAIRNFIEAETKRD